MATRISKSGSLTPTMYTNLAKPLPATIPSASGSSTDRDSLYEDMSIPIEKKKRLRESTALTDDDGRPPDKKPVDDSAAPE